ncbi:MAG TPA: hypothetical protein VFO31_04325 [Vicinamibacterales bacterium]|nr:hypothetical protein [Vicinamibacterales bacterium]
MRSLTFAALCAFAVMAVAGPDLAGQGRGGGAPAVPRTGRQLAPVDLTGTWVSIVTEDWRWRMVTPPKGDVASIPVNAEGRKAAASWNPDADAAAGNACKAFGVGGIMRQPGRLRISWQDDQTLKLEFDAGTQTRLLNFDPAKRPSEERTFQGFSVATWEGPGVGAGPVGDGRNDTRVTGGGLLSRDLPGGGGGGLRGGPPPRQQAQINRGGDLRVVTTAFREGYLRKNGVPYSEQATITEYIHRLPTHPNGDAWLHVITVVEDPRYLTQPFYTSTSFRLEPNDANFKPTPCATPAPLPVKTSTR